MAGVGEAAPSEFGRLVARYREARNLSGERLAQMAGLSRAYVSQVETGKRGHRPTRDNVIAIAQALRAPVVEFLRAAGRLEPGDTLSPDERLTFEEFVHTDPALTTQQKEALVRIYRTWVPQEVRG